MTRDAKELTAAIATAVVHVLPLERLYPEVFEIVVLVIGWLGYLVSLVARDRPRLAEMGFRREGLRASAAAAFGFAGLATAGMGLWGWRAGTLAISANVVILAVLYPIYGLVQQWLVQGVFARQLARRAPAAVTVLATATMFGLLHLPDRLAAVATFVLGFALVPIYLRWRNLWALGFVHGWLAIPMYFWVAGVDPWAAAIRHT